MSGVDGVKGADDLSLESRLSMETAEAYLRQKVLAPWGDKKEAVGIEIERFVVRNLEEDWEGILHENESKHQAMLLAMAHDHDWRIVSEPLEDRYVIVGYELPRGGRITFEPGKQLEHSSDPHEKLSELMQEVDEVRQLILEGLHKEDSHMDLLSMGSYPFVAAESYDSSAPRLLVSKKRYEVMADHFAKIGPWGYRLMIQTSSNQVCMDVGSTHEEVAARYNGANLLVPWIYGIFAFSPFLDGKFSEYASFRSYTARLFDPARSGINGSLLAKLSSVEDAYNFSWVVDSYRDFALNCPLIYIDPQRYNQPLKGSLNLATWMKEGYRGQFPTVEDLSWHLSLVFPEVRLKERFFELRCADGQAPCWEFVVPVFYLCLLLDEKIRARLLELLLGEVSALDDWWLKSSSGLADKDFAQLAVKIMELALEGASKNLEIFQGAEEQLKRLEVFADHFTFRSRTPADDLKDAYEKCGGEFRWSMWQKLMDQWNTLIEKA